jgi:hypothetical protein
LPSPEYEKDFGIVRVLGEDYVTFTPIRRALRSVELSLDTASGYAKLFSIANLVVGNWPRPVTVTVRSQKTLRSKGPRHVLRNTRTTATPLGVNSQSPGNRSTAYLNHIPHQRASHRHPPQSLHLTVRPTLKRLSRKYHSSRCSETYLQGSDRTFQCSSPLPPPETDISNTSLYSPPRRPNTPDTTPLSVHSVITTQIIQLQTI